VIRLGNNAAHNVNVNKYYFGNNNDDNNNNTNENKNNTNAIINPNPKQLITKFILNGTSIYWWWNVLLSYIMFNKKDQQQIIGKNDLKNKLLSLWKNIIGQYESIINNKEEIIHNCNGNHAGLIGCSIKYMVLDFVNDNELFTYKFYKELQRTFEKSNAILDFFKEKFPQQSKNVLQMATTLGNILIKRAYDCNNDELLLLLQIHLQFVPDSRRKAYDSIYDDIIDKVQEENITGKQFCIYGVDEIVMKMGYYSFQQNNKYIEEQLVIFETWNFIHDY